MVTFEDDLGLDKLAAELEFAADIIESGFMNEAQRKGVAAAIRRAVAFLNAQHRINSVPAGNFLDTLTDEEFCKVAQMSDSEFLEFMSTKESNIDVDGDLLKKNG